MARSNISFAAVVFGLALSAVSVQVIASAPVPTSNKVSVVVRYNDLDLADSAGVETLHARVKQAATKVCAGDRSIKCQQVAIAEAQPQVALALAKGSSRSSLAVSAH